MLWTVKPLMSIQTNKWLCSSIALHPYTMYAHITYCLSQPSPPRTTNDTISSAEATPPNTFEINRNQNHQHKNSTHRVCKFHANLHVAKPRRDEHFGLVASEVVFIVGLVNEMGFDRSLRVKYFLYITRRVQLTLVELLVMAAVFVPSCFFTARIPQESTLFQCALHFLVFNSLWFDNIANNTRWVIICKVGGQYRRDRQMLA